MQDSGLPDDFVCHAFPDAENPVHGFLVGLISFAVAFPFGAVVVELLCVSNEPEFENGTLTWSGLYALVLGRQNWRWKDTRPWLLTRSIAKYIHDPVLFVLEPLWQSIEAGADAIEWLACCGWRHKEAEEKPSAKDLQTDYGETYRRRRKRMTGLGFIYAVWAVQCWMIFVYGRLIYDLLGAGSETAFIKSWFTGIGIDNATQFKDIVVEGLKVALILMLLERLMMSQDRWFSQHVDFLSVQATLFSGAGSTWWQRMKVHMRFYAADNGAD